MVAYACSPDAGSEPGVGWGWATQMARWCDVWVICEADRYLPAVQRHLDRHGPLPHLQFHGVSKRPLASRLEIIPGLGYLAYNRWHRDAFALASRLHHEVGFDLTHQVTFCTYREPGYAAHLRRSDGSLVPFVWGPVGGTQNYPWNFLHLAGCSGAFREGLRSVANTLQLRASPRVRRAARSAGAMLAANTTIQRHLRNALGVEAEVLLETGVRQIEESPPRPAGPFRLIWSGDLSPWKAMPLLLEALAQLPRGFECEVTILGRGYLRADWERMSRRLGVAGRLRWLGWVPFEEAQQAYHEADALVFTSLRDTSGNVVLEALARGLPVVCLDHQGVRDIVTEDCGIKVPPTDPPSVIRGLRDAIVTLASDAELRRRLGAGARERAREYLWDHQGERMWSIYRRVLGQETPEAAALASSVAPSQPTPGVLGRFKERCKDLGQRLAGNVAASLRTVGGPARAAVGILVYHRVAANTVGVPSPTMNVTPMAFRRQLAGLRELGYAIWPLRRLLAHRQAGEPIPGRVAVVTFDDGFGNVHGAAWPVLRDLGLPATVFLNTAFLDSPGPFPFDRWGLTYQGHVPSGSYRPLTREECRELHASGLVELGAHTHTHQDFRGRPDEFRHDLTLNVGQLRETFGLNDATFAFPFGRRSWGYTSDELIEAARATGVLCGLTTEATPVNVCDDPFGWGRFNCYEWDTAATLAAKIEGWYGWAPAVQEWLGSRTKRGDR